MRVLLLSILLAATIAMEPVRAARAREAADATTHPASVAQYLHHALSHKDRTTRFAQLDALARDGSKEALAALGTILLKGDDDDLRQAALDALIAAGDKGGVDVLADFLWKGGWVWRIKVAEALRQWGSPKAIPALEIVAKDPELRVRRVGGGALSVIKARIAREREADIQARIKAMGRLVDGGNPQAEALLKEALSDVEFRVRAAAALTLGRLRTGGAADLLKALGDDKTPGVMKAVQWAQMRMAGGQVARARGTLAEKLHKPLTKPPAKLSLGQSIARIENECGIRIYIAWSTLKTWGIEKDRLVSYDHTSLAAALDSLLRQMGEPRIDWIAEHDIVLIASWYTLVTKRLHSCEVPMAAVDTMPQATRSLRTRLALRSPRQEFKAVRLGDCLDFVRQSANVDVFARDSALHHVTRSSAMTARTSGASVADMLTLLLQGQKDWPWQTHAAYAVVDGMILVSSPKDLERLRQSRPKGLNIVEAMIEEDVTGGSWTLQVRRGGMLDHHSILWLVNTDRVTTAARVLERLDVQWRGDVSTVGLFLAMHAGRVKLARLFSDSGADVNAPWEYQGSRKSPSLDWTREPKRPPLYLAAWLGNAEFVGMLMKAGAKPDIVDEKVGSPLHVAVSRGNYMAVAALLAGGADIENDWKGTRPLHLAAQLGHKRIASLLIYKGARPDAPSKEGTPLQRTRAAAMLAKKEFENATGKQRIAELQTHIANLRAVEKLLQTHIAQTQR